MNPAKYYIFLILLAAVALSADLSLDEDAPPANPREFHDREWQRIARGMQMEERPPVASTQQDYDALYYHLTIDVRQYAAHVIYGNVLMVARSLAPDLDEVVLDLCEGLVVDSVVYMGGPRAFTRDGHLLTINLGSVYGAGQVFSGRVYYHGIPCATNLYPSFTWYNRLVGTGTIPTVYTLSEPYGARDWWPSKNLPEDKADSVRISIIVADTLTATSNGVLEAVTPLPPSSRQFTWFEKHPIATYLVSLNATNYTSYTEWYVALNGDSMPIVHYPYPERINAAQISWNVVPAMMDFCADVFGEYPFVDEKYGHTMFNINGGMEHQCNTSYGRGITNGQHTYDYIVLHELAHQWFGDAVTLETWPDIWLNEGFASYAEALWFEHLNGFGAYRAYMLAPTDLGVTDPSGPVYNPTNLFSGNSVYNKGAWILHILRGAVRNDPLFFAMLREYYDRHAHSTANTEQFLADVSSVAGYDVTPFLHTYLYRTNRPVFRVSFGSGVVDGGVRTVARVRQAQTDPDTTFHTRLDLAFAGPSGDTTVSVVNANWRQDYFFNFGWIPTALAVDPDDWVLKSLSYEPLAPTVLNAGLSLATASFGYSDTLVAIGGQPPYTWSVAGGQLPAGFTLWSTGLLTGMTGDTGTFVFTARVQDAPGVVDTAAFILRVNSPLTAPERLTVYRVGSNVQLRWRRVLNATSYAVYRATQGDLSDAQLIGTTQLSTWSDPVSPPGEPDTSERRYYFVIAQRHWP